MKKGEVKNSILNPVHTKLFQNTSLLNTIILRHPHFYLNHLLLPQPLLSQVPSLFFNGGGLPISALPLTGFKCTILTLPFQPFKKMDYDIKYGSSLFLLCSPSELPHTIFSPHTPFPSSPPMISHQVFLSPPHLPT